MAVNREVIVTGASQERVLNWLKTSFAPQISLTISGMLYLVILLLLPSESPPFPSQFYTVMLYDDRTIMYFATNINCIS